MKRAFAVVALLGLAGCNLIDELLNPEPAPEAAYVVTLGDQVCRSGAVPFSVSFDMTGKNPGTAEREEVTIWAFTEGGDWAGGNSRGSFTVRCNDSRPDWAKMKTYNEGGTFVGEPALKMAWSPDQTYSVSLDVEVGAVRWEARNAGQGLRNAWTEVATPERVTICYGDPGSRKAAIGARLKNIKWGGQQ